MLSFMWSVGINITSSILFATPKVVGGYGFNAKALGFLYLTPIVGVSLGELFGHFFNDFSQIDTRGSIMEALSPRHDFGPIILLHFS